jgi:hypothetical protein
MDRLRRSLALVAALVAVAVLGTLPTPAAAQATPPTFVAAYESLATVILGARQAEADLVRALLDGHYRHAEARLAAGDAEGAAAEIALFANEGDNAVGGVRKRLIEGGHHHNAAGEAQGVYEPGYVIVTRSAKQAALEASANLRRASTDAERQAAWDAFAAVAEPLLKKPE